MLVTLTQLNEQLLTGLRDFRSTPSSPNSWNGAATTDGPEAASIGRHAEALALASLLVEGVPIRLTGQDAERGTFSQRHIVLHDATTAAKSSPMQPLPDARPHSKSTTSPLSELASLGFEYGYARRAGDPGALGGAVSATSPMAPR